MLQRISGNRVCRPQVRGGEATLAVEISGNLVHVAPAYDSEIWGDVNQMATDFDRQGGFSSAYLRATDPVSADALKHRVSDDQRLKLEGLLETEYYAKQTSSGAPIRIIGW